MIAVQILSVMSALLVGGVVSLGQRRQWVWKMRWTGGSIFFCIAGIGLLSLGVNVAVVRARGWPGPRIHDEFSYLLAADTFAAGRLTNPPHKFWRFFVTFHVLQQPTYMSKYPPGQGLVLALGQVVCGEPIVGAWVVSAALCAGAVWMLRGFVPLRWAVLGGVLLAVHPQIVEWSQTYWGGGVAGLGGVMLLGAWARIGNAGRRGFFDGIIFGLGMGVLMISRPYEGLVFSVPLIASRVRRSRWMLGALGPVVVAVGFIGLDNYRVTGNLFQLPYAVYEKQYAVAPPFLWQSPRPEPMLRHQEMKDYAEQVEVPHFEAQRTVGGFVRIGGEKLSSLSVGVAPVWLMWGVVLVVPWAIVREGKLRVPMLAIGAILLATAASNWTRSQYVAPACGAVLVIVVAGLFILEDKARSVAWGLAGGVVVGAAGLLIARPIATEHFQRGLLADELDHAAGRHLVLIRYLPGHRLDDEWVYNRADIDGAKVVWAHDMGEAENVELLNYFSGRHVWRVDVGKDAARVNDLSGSP